MLEQLDLDTPATPLHSEAIVSRKRKRQEQDQAQDVVAEGDFDSDSGSAMDAEIGRRGRSPLLDRSSTLWELVGSHHDGIESDRPNPPSDSERADQYSPIQIDVFDDNPLDGGSEHASNNTSYDTHRLPERKAKDPPALGTRALKRRRDEAPKRPSPEVRKSN
ncbi:uncharacterized protein MYCGRDRAFT_97959 [Zymoseptoria tritici IPO323]|uniref:Uncharacterized protein n=1 Tax=Zymoseptoria tritici (strain CBS 115943 / IPO323) TaxID=336722 RepID=F9XRW5_ZYMTI|nr:uncharacterized protein MYCGRDRAFT_97959 [Zymoseptoria tritici IPO323]EGP81988.1 hypothetical protein MYCGRDRAFT_97959 [Zymoseptoria tritici IPO323]